MDSFESNPEGDEDRPTVGASKRKGFATIQIQGARGGGYTGADLRIAEARGLAQALLDIADLLEKEIPEVEDE